jgi:hypothetical protein
VLTVHRRQRTRARAHVRVRSVFRQAALSRQAALRQGPAAGVLVALVALVSLWVAPASAGAEAAAVSLHASFSPDRLGAATTFTLGFHFSGGAEGVPPPLRTVVVQLPIGLHFQLGGLAVCQPARLRRRGPSGCPSSSLVGRGHALLQVHAGTEPIDEEASLWVERGPEHEGLPSFGLFGQGYTPLYQSAVSTELLQTASPPYGYRTVTTVPPIPTVMYEPNASFVSLSLSFGNVKHHSGPGTFFTPRTCPPGGFPFAAQVTYANGESASTTATVPCP